MPGLDGQPFSAIFPDMGANISVHYRKVIVMGKDMDRESADRIIAAADRDPDSPTATSGFADRADAAATRNDDDEEDED